MSTVYGPYIKVKRIEKGISQSAIADKLGMSRPSYLLVEQGKKELTLSEAEKISDFFGVSLREVESGIASNFLKYKQIVLSFLRNCEGDGYIPKTKLAKLVYFADFAWFYENLKSMSGMRYRKIQHGPVPDEYFRAIDELYEDGYITIDTTSDGAMLIAKTRNGEKCSLTELSVNEQKLIKDISKKWKNKNTKEIVAFTHNQLPYSLCTVNEIIPYELITQENPEDVY